MQPHTPEACDPNAPPPSPGPLPADGAEPPNQEMLGGLGKPGPVQDPGGPPSMQVCLRQLEPEGPLGKNGRSTWGGGHGQEQWPRHRSLGDSRGELVGELTRNNNLN